MGKTERGVTATCTPGHLEELRDALLEERDMLARQIRALSSASLTSNRQAGEELADVGSDDFIRETELHLLGEEGKRLASINLALESLDNGRYGICMDCNGKISIGRLRAKPYARLCIECKSAREKNGGFPPSEDDY